MSAEHEIHMLSPAEFAELVNRAFREKRKPDGLEYTNVEVARAIGVHHSTLSAWRSGKSDNPNRESLLRFALFFGLKASDVLPELAEAEQQIEDPNRALQRVLSLMGLKEDEKHLVLTLVERLRQ